MASGVSLHAAPDDHAEPIGCLPVYAWQQMAVRPHHEHLVRVAQPRSDHNRPYGKGDRP